MTVTMFENLLSSISEMVSENEKQTDCISRAIHPALMSLQEQMLADKIYYITSKIDGVNRKYTISSIVGKFIHDVRTLCREDCIQINTIPILTKLIDSLEKCLALSKSKDVDKE